MCYLRKKDYKKRLDALVVISASRSLCSRVDREGSCSPDHCVVEWTQKGRVTQTTV